MQVTVQGNGVSDSMKLNVNQSNFKVTLIGILKDGFDGNYTVEYSPDEETWIAHEEMSALTLGTTGDLFFNIPWIRLNTAGSTKGSVTLHAIQGA